MTDHHPVTVSIVNACANAGALDAAADALRVAERIVTEYTSDTNRDTIRFDVLSAVRAAVMGEPDPIRAYGINMTMPHVDRRGPLAERGRVHATVAHMLNQTRWLEGDA